VSLIDTLLSGQLLFATLVIGSIYALVALGLNLVYGTLRLLNVAHGDLVMLGAYGAFWLFTLAGLSPLLALPLLALGGALLGAIVYRGLFKRLLQIERPPQRIEANSLLLFFGLSILFQNLAAQFFTVTPRAYRYLDDVWHLGAVAMTGNRLTALAIAAGLCIAVTLFLRFHVFGLALRAVIQQRDAAHIVGVNVERVQMVSFQLGFASAAVAGGLISMLEQFSPFSGFPFTIAAFVVVILGGLGNLFAGLVSAFLLAAIETYGVALTSPNYRSVLLYGTFVLALLLFPQGLLGRRVAR
jgi:branched-chain amino acid transport system permease protein